MSLEVKVGSNYIDTTKHIQSSDYIKKESDIYKEVNGSSDKDSVTNKSRISNDESVNEQKDKQTADNQVKNAIIRANKKMKNHRTRFEFSYHETTKRVSIKVLDKETDEVICEIPPEETLDMIEKLWEIAGLLIDEKR